MDELVPWKTLFLGSYDSFLHSLFVQDDDIASVSWTRNVNIKDEGYAYSLMFSHLHRVLQESRDPALKQRFPRGIPSTGDVSSQFLLETAVDWIGARLARLRRPFVGYFHLLAAARAVQHVARVLQPVPGRRTAADAQARGHLHR